MIPRESAARLVLAAFVLFLLVTSVQVVHKASRPDGYDFTSFYLSARAVLDGTDIYATGAAFPYLYPAFLAAALAPLALLPLGVLHIPWFLLNVAALLHAVHLLATDDHRGGRGRIRGLTMLAVLVLVCATPLHNHFLNGQVNLLVLWLCVVWWVLEFRQDRPVAAGIALGAAVAIKLLPIVFLGLLFWERRSRSLAIATVAAAAFVILPYVVVHGQLEALAGYVDGFVVASLSSGEPLFRDIHAFTLARVGPGLVPALGESAAWPWIARLSIVMLIVAAHLSARRVSVESRAPYLLALYSLALILLSPMSETHHLVFALPAVWFVVRAAGTPPTAAGWRITAGVGVACWGLGLAGMMPRVPWLFLALHVLLLGLVVHGRGLPRVIRR